MNHLPNPATPPAEQAAAIRPFSVVHFLMLGIGGLLA